MGPTYTHIRAPAGEVGASAWPNKTQTFSFFLFSFLFFNSSTTSFPIHLRPLLSPSLSPPHASLSSFYTCCCCCCYCQREKVRNDDSRRSRERERGLNCCLQTCTNLCHTHTHTYIYIYIYIYIRKVKHSARAAIGTAIKCRSSSGVDIEF